MLHLVILGLLTILGAGLVSLSVVARRSHEHRSPLTAGLAVPLLRYNLWVLTWLAFVSLTPLPDTLGPPLAVRALEATLQAAHTGVSWLWIVSMAGYSALAIYGDRAETIRRAVRHATLVVILVGCVVWADITLPGPAGPSLPILRFSAVAVAPLALGISLWLARSAGRVRVEALRAPLRALALSYVIPFGGSTGWLLWILLVNPAHKRFLVVRLAFDVLYNALTVAWVLRYGERLARQQPPPAVPLATAPAGLEALAADYGISRREREVVALICKGKTNQEIADALFISLKTVKEHNYRVFQKTGVRNRVELTRLVTGPHPSVPE